MTATIRVAELFGPTIQGEGRNAGQRAGFVRLVDCNLDCAWCDTPHTWDWTGKNGKPFVRVNEYRPLTPDDVLDALGLMGVPRVVVTGGEPLLRPAQFSTLVEALTADGYRVEVETNGTLAPPVETFGMVDQWNVSPKLSGAGTTLPSIVPDVLDLFVRRENADFKFVIATASDLDEVSALADRYHLPRSRVWLMPEGTTVAEQVENTRMVAEQAVARGFNFTSRLHTLAWGNERGR